MLVSHKCKKGRTEVIFYYFLGFASQVRVHQPLHDTE